MEKWISDLITPDRLGHLPFMMMNIDGKAKPNYSRLIEIAFLAGMAYMGFKMIQNDISEMKPMVKQIPVIQSQVDGLDKRQMRIEDHLMAIKYR